MCDDGALWEGTLLATLLFKLAPLLPDVLPMVWEVELMRVDSSIGTFLSSGP